MRFAAVTWLWALLAIPVIYLLLLWDERRRRLRFEQFADTAVWKSIVPDADWSARPRKARVFAIALFFAILALARPQWGSHEEVIRVTGMDLLTVLDVSSSMDAEDVIPSRLQKAKHLLRSLADHVRGDRMGIVAFAGSAFLACPLTTDLDYMLETAQVLTPRSIANQGTDIGGALDTARRALDRGAEEGNIPGAGGPTEEGESKPTRIVLLISDGEDQEAGAVESARKLKEAGIRLYVYGIGTQKGAPIPLRDDSGVKVGFKHDHKGEVVVSRFQPDALVSLAAAGGGRYWNASLDEGEVGDLLHEMGGMSRGDYAERRYLVYEERFQWPLALALLLLFLETSMAVRKIRQREHVAAVRALGATALLSLLFLAMALTVAIAPRSAEAKQPPVSAYVENEKGVKAYQDGNMEEAKRDFGSAQAMDPSLPELDFNRGVIQLQEGDMDGAIEAFGRSAQDKRLTGRSQYNQGIALGKKGDYQNALRAYLGAIQHAQQDQDSALEEDARKNIELLMNQRQQQKQQSKSGKQNQQQKPDQNQNQQQKPGDGQDKPNDKDQKDPQDPKNQQNQNQQKHYQDEASKQKQFRSQKLSREDADRVMSELTSKDRDLQSRFNRQNANPQGNPNDW